MFTQTCSLLFRDGTIITAQVTADTEIEDGSVWYSGPIERLPLHPATASACELRAYFSSFARELQARFTEDAKDDRMMRAREIDRLLEGLKGFPARQDRPRARA
jgi:hypothetical protein